MNEFPEVRVLTDSEHIAALNESITDANLQNIINTWTPTATSSETETDGTIHYYAYYDDEIPSSSQPWNHYNMGFLIRITQLADKHYSQIWIFDNCPGFLFRTLARVKHTVADTCKHVNAILHIYASFLSANNLTPNAIPAGIDDVTLIKLSDEFQKELLSHDQGDDRMRTMINTLEGKTVSTEAPVKKKRAKKADSKPSTINGTVFLPRLKKIYDYALAFLEGTSSIAQTQLTAMFFVGAAGTGKTQVANTIMKTLTTNNVAHTEELAGVSIDPNKYAEYLLGTDTMAEATVMFQPGILLRGLQSALKENKNTLVILIHEFNRSTGLVHLDSILRSIGDTGYIQFNSQAENMPDIIKALDPLPIQYVGGSLYRVDLAAINEHVRFLLTGNMGVEYQVQEIPQALRGRLMFMDFPNYTPQEMEEIFTQSSNFAGLSDNERRMVLSTYSMFYNLLTNAQILALPRITEILGAVDFALVDPALAAQNLRSQLGEENLPDNIFNDLVTLFTKKGEEEQETVTA